MGAKMNNRERILRYLQSIHPKEATVSEIESATGVSPHSQVYQKTQQLLTAGQITGYQKNRTWHFKAKSVLGEVNSFKDEVPKEKQKLKLSSAEFEAFAKTIFSKNFQVELRPGSLLGIAKIWDMISDNGEIVGDAKYYTLVGGTRQPPAKFSTIAEHVWLLEKTEAEVKFLVFGNQIEVPQLWLKKYGDLVRDVQFFFLDDSGNITKLN